MGIALRTSQVLAVPAAEARDAYAHFAFRLSVEADCTDVADDIKAGVVEYTVIDVRGEASYAAGHVQGAVNVPARTIDGEVARSLPDGLLVVYCWSPGCNGAHKAAAALSSHGRQVKEMIGGFEYWIREGLPIEGEAADRLAGLAEHELVG